ncbi:hypothetical protein GCM10007216_27740 [Thalassobacillus devorans]|uniref:RCK N-terminal domain-containing protein n=1 Tax=Thalassobacillus devorans TaxID=279813 RepID=A0ABQ1PE84_9BACI|nr:NAD-binding protein [Thalassobacillus devorans]NIK29278.1 voltage-gated potassium channel [Thalassobacillus devorans]GGC95441.1 hypothetical protein GCM10007216_27740 [Thalassobacillus devorans]
MEDHHIIIGWNILSVKLIQAIRANGKDEDIILIDNSLGELPEMIDKVTYIKGDAYNQEVLAEAHIQSAKDVIITADPSKEEGEADKYSIMFTIAAKAANPDVRVITEILTSKQAENAKRVGASSIIKSYEILGMLMYHQMTGRTAELFKSVQ